MTVTVGNSPVIMTAQGDSIGNDGKNWFVKNIQVVANSSGQFILLDKEGGKEVFRSAVLNANDSENLQVDQWMDGVYVSQLPTGGRVYIHYR